MVELEPTYAQDLCYTAQDDRLVLGGLVCEEGVQSFTGLRVTQDSGADMNVVVSPGGAWVANDNDGSDDEQGMYHVFSTAVKTIPIDPNASGVTRTDTIWLRVCDTAFSIAPSGFEIYYLPNDSTAPGDGCSYYLLATLLVPNAVAAITGEPANFGETDGLITDNRNLFSTCGGGGLREIVVFNASDTFDKGDYPWLKSVRVRGIAAGGAGGGAPATTVSESSCGAGGASGEYGEVALDVQELAASETVTIGASGAGAAGAGGGTGSDTSFGAHLVLEGGPGGAVISAGTVPAFARGGVGVGGGVGDFTVRGAAGEKAARGSATSVGAGSGGTGPFGGSGVGDTAFSSGGATGGAAEANSGAGGGGAHNVGSNGARPGGAGGSGLIIVELYG